MNTRFNPTTNGNMHMGHLYILLVNEFTAHSSPNGKFIVRFDDTQPEWVNRLGDQQLVFANNMMNNLNWLGVKVDEYLFQSNKDLQYATHKVASANHVEIKPDYPPHIQAINPATKIGYYSFTPGFTLEKVIMDYLYGINALIRGSELATEASLYNYYCKLLGLQQPLQVYLPRLITMESNISKTNGNYTVNSLMENRWTPSLILERLRHACLRNPYGTWSITNVKETPLWID
jgi:glutamyl/glutaminyl-tRNA synthetase